MCNSEFERLHSKALGELILKGKPFTGRHICLKMRALDQAQSPHRRTCDITNAEASLETAKAYQAGRFPESWGSVYARFDKHVGTVVYTKLPWYWRAWRRFKRSMFLD